MIQYSLRSTLALPLSALLLLSGCTATPSRPVRAGEPKAIDQYVVGYQAYKRGETEVARQTLESAVINNPDLRMARMVLGEIYRNNNDYTSAAGQYEVLSRIDPYTLSNHYYLGVSYQFLTRYKESVAAYLKGLKLDPADFRTNMNLGTVYLSLGDADEAVRYLDKATQIDPSSAVAWSNLGVALDARNSVVLAETAYRKALERNPDSVAILQNLANNMILQKREGEAKYFWEQVVQRSRTPYTETKLAEALTIGIGADFKRATEILDDLLKREPRYLPAINAKAQMHVKQYELSSFLDDKYRVQAVELMRRSLSMNGNQAQLADQLKKLERPSAIGP